MTTEGLSLDGALRASAAVVAFSSAVIAFEYWALVRRGLFTKGGLLDWEVLSTVHRWTCAGRAANFLATVFSPVPFKLLILSQVVLSVLLGVASLTGAMKGIGCLCLALYLISLMLAVRHPFGRDGADEMLSILFFGLAVATLAPDQAIKVVAIIYVCGQLILSYVVAGSAKLRSRAWMREGILSGILSTEIYGGRRAWLGRWFSKHPRMDLSCGLMVVFMEVSYPLIFLPSRALAVTLLVATWSFHFATAALMGLNTFLFVFSGAIILMFWFRMSF
jgi:hypothetical protein